MTSRIVLAKIRAENTDETVSRQAERLCRPLPGAASEPDDFVAGLATPIWQAMRGGAQPDPTQAPSASLNRATAGSP